MTRVPIKVKKKVFAFLLKELKQEEKTCYFGVPEFLF